DFIMFPELEGQVISRFALMEKSRLIAYPDGDVELVFVELPKFQRGLDELRGLTDEWLFFVDSAADMEAVPVQLSEVPEIEDAFEIAEAARLTPLEEHRLELKNRWIADQKMILAMKLDAEAQAKLAEARANLAEEKAHQAEEKAHQAEGKAHQAEEKAHQAEEKAHQAEGKAHQAEAQASLALKEAHLAREQAKQEAAKVREVLQATARTLAELGQNHAAIAAKLNITEALVSELLEP
ncbi:MAG: hypothetical protein KDK99_15510, partial [Verrucomicrobiales bacterium]|nr:hypothetical protein [Verrucomicrobiales bacterium]